MVSTRRNSLKPTTMVCLASLGTILFLGQAMFYSLPSSTSAIISPHSTTTTAATTTATATTIGKKHPHHHHHPPNRRKIRQSSQQQDDDKKEHDEPIRMGSCSQVSYGTLNLSQTQQKKEPEEMSLNELLIHLDHPASVSSPNPNGPVIVDIGLYVNGIANLDPGSNTFFMEGYLDLVWCDSRTRFLDPNEETMNNDGTSDGNDGSGGSSSSSSSSSAFHIYLEQDAEKEIEEIWWPSITFVNEVTSRNIENQELIMSSDGTIEYREKFGVTLSTNFDNMEQFPFDQQTLIAEIESFAWNSDILQFVVEQDLIGFSKEFDIPEYEITSIEEHLRTVQEIRDRHAFSELVAEIHVLHIPTYFMTKVIIPLALINFISWAVFWMDCDALADRMAISFTGVLTSVAYQFVVSDSLPRHIYNTFLDNFVLISFVLMISTVVANIIVHAMWTKGFTREAQWVDKMCRICFPALFMACVFVLAGAQVMRDYLTIGGVIGCSFAAFAVVAAMAAYKVYLYRQQISQLEEEEEQQNSEEMENEELIFGSSKKDKTTKDVQVLLGKTTQKVEFAPRTFHGQREKMEP